MKKIFLLAISILSTLWCNAQHEPSDSVFYKHEIGANIGFIITSMMGKASVKQPTGIVFKKMLTDNWYFRTSYNYINDYPFGNFNDYLVEDTIYRVEFKNHKLQKHIVSAGVEYRYHFKSNIALIVGGDIHFRHRIRVDEFTISDYTLLDSITYPNGEQSLNYNKSALSSEYIYYEKDIRNEVGAGFSVGVLIPLGKKWQLVAQQRLDAFYGSITNSRLIHKAEHLTSDNLETTKSTGLNFSTRPIISEFSLFYKF